ncbi:adenylate/guanylate cyclase domain-containing protein [Sinimarinibacterium sp. NLF-5-8]|uniref:adenylate/guanylate cyclase domain-containing protein n=1 Tax=Sinimarinibacterium sp. NLF-5-8 TaxID=2698684 RepID=UPI00137BFB68|nr:adenylate/guanylate cyclase domain-containing protein [Sinimarinibacterium sp. NLF-5-8]QHS10143.1 adenylate/guanylate cyclase domain-containing protein [Sinimarinibacterium sp. NLF-5-8]
MNTGYEVVAVIALGMGLAFWLSDRKAPTSRALALFVGLLGLALLVNAQVVEYWLQPQLPVWMRGIGVLDAAAFIAGGEWGLRVSRTVQITQGERLRIALMRGAQAMALLYALAVMLWPDLRYGALGQALDQGRWPPMSFMVFVLPMWIGCMLVLVAGTLLLRQKPDQAEYVRILAVLAATPILLIALLLPVGIAPLILAVGEVVVLYGGLRYHAILGARGAFMSQFLSPQVASLVREQGLRRAMARQRLEVTVVCCDIRRFTAHTQGHSPEDVMRLLRAFYAAVAAATQEFGGTVKDLAGDGAMILIGAPMAYPDRQQRAINLARRLQARVRPVLKRFSPELGLGVGVASGTVVVGIIGESGRYEYMAVGPAMNLAARLCGKAADGEIHVDEKTLEECGGCTETLSMRRRRRYVKGIGILVPSYILEGGEDVPAPPPATPRIAGAEQSAADHFGEDEASLRDLA